MMFLIGAAFIVLPFYIPSTEDISAITLAQLASVSVGAFLVVSLVVV